MGDPQFDPTRGDQALRRARDDLSIGDPRGAEHLLSAAEGTETELVAEAVASGDGLRHGLAEWLRADPGNPSAWLLSAVNRLESLAWQFSDNVLRERDPLPDEHATGYRAIDDLYRALETGSETARVWLAVAAGRMAYRGFCPKTDFDEVARDADVVRSDSPLLLRARIRLEDPLDPSRPALRLARNAGTGLPGGHPARVEVVTAHVEHYLSLLDSNREAAIAYWQDDFVEQELSDISNSLLQQPDSPRTVDGHNLLAFALARTRSPRLARPHFTRLDNRFVAWPWTLLTRPAVAFKELQARTRVLRLGR